MPFTKTFGTTAGAYSTETCWRKISVRTPAFSWTASGSGTNEYYCRTAANGNPGFVSSPTTNLVFLNSVAAASGSLGSLTAGQFGFGDNDTLGYSTLYVRLADGADPDSKTLDWVQFQQMPKAGEHVRWIADSASINSATGLDQSAVAIGDFIVEEGCEAEFGSESLGYLSIDPDRFEFSGKGEAWINLHTAAIPVRIFDTFSPNEGEFGLYLRGTGMTIVDISGGTVGIAARAGEISTATTVRLLGEDTKVTIGSGCSLTNLHVYKGTVAARCGITTVIIYGGELWTEESGAMGTVTMKGGTYVANSTGTITTFHAYNGFLDLMKSGAARTITTLNLYNGTAQIPYNKEAVTITTLTINDSLNLNLTGLQ